MGSTVSWSPFFNPSSSSSLTLSPRGGNGDTIGIPVFVMVQPCQMTPTLIINLALFFFNLVSSVL